MSTTNIEVDEELIGILRELQRPIDKAVKRIIPLVARESEVAAGLDRTMLRRLQRSFHRTGWLRHARRRKSPRNL